MSRPIPERWSMRRLVRWAERTRGCLEIAWLPTPRLFWGVDPMGAPAAVAVYEHRGRTLEIYCAPHARPDGGARWSYVSREGGLCGCCHDCAKAAEPGALARGGEISKLRGAAQWLLKGDTAA